MSEQEFALRLSAAAGEVLAEFIKELPRDSNPRPYTHREIIFLLNKAVVKGADIALSELENHKKVTP